ncbi:mitogen-activated protein kinase kinase kinase 17-like protein [Tanacetum coccineum]
MSNNKKRKNQEQDQQHSINYGDGMSWFRGCLIGKGCYGSVFLANLKKPKSRHSSYPRIMAVKSAEVSVSGSIQKEKEILDNIRGCRNVIKCYGEEITNGENNNQMVYNLLLEYGSGGTLADVIKESNNGNGLREFNVKRYARSILRGLCHIHNCGYVHCDLKPENILLVGNSVNKFSAKIGDLGLAKRAKQSKKSKSDTYWRGTPMYFSPEVVIDGVQESPSDIWAFGCIVLEMLTGNSPWGSMRETNCDEVLARIGNSNEVPLIPSTLSREVKSFLKGCFSRKAMYRWTAEMLLAHPFLEGVDDDEENDDSKVEESSEVLDINAITSSEDDDGIEHDVSSCFSVEDSLEAERSTTAALNQVHQYPIAFTISGV